MFCNEIIYLHKLRKKIIIAIALPLNEHNEKFLFFEITFFMRNKNDDNSLTFSYSLTHIHTHALIRKWI